MLGRPDFRRLATKRTVWFLKVSGFKGRTAAVALIGTGLLRPAFWTDSLDISVREETVAFWTEVLLSLFDI